MVKVITKKEYDELVKDELVIDNDFKSNDVSGTNSFSGLCCLCGELIKAENQRVPLKVGPVKQKVAHRNCVEAYARKNGKI